VSEQEAVDFVRPLLDEISVTVNSAAATAAHKLVQYALNQKESSDNISVVIIKLQPEQLMIRQSNNKY
jgi:serine/threonine protein phosphatase PrpC